MVIWRLRLVFIFCLNNMDFLILVSHKFTHLNSKYLKHYGSSYFGYIWSSSKYLDTTTPTQTNSALFGDKIQPAPTYRAGRCSRLPPAAAAALWAEISRHRISIVRLLPTFLPVVAAVSLVTGVNSTVVYDPQVTRAVELTKIAFFSFDCLLIWFLSVSHSVSNNILWMMTGRIFKRFVLIGCFTTCCITDIVEPNIEMEMEMIKRTRSVFQTSRKKVMPGFDSVVFCCKREMGAQKGQTAWHSNTLESRLHHT